MLQPRSERIEVTPETVDGLLDDYGDEYWIAREIAATFAGCAAKSISAWAAQGKVRKFDLPKRKHQPWTAYNVGDVLRNRAQRRECQPFLRKKKDDGRYEYRCNVCEVWKDEDEFYDNARPNRPGSHAKLTYCKTCHNERAKKRRANDEDLRDREKKRARMIYNALKQRRIEAGKYEPPYWVEAEKVTAILDRCLPKDDDQTERMHDKLLSDRAGQHEDLIRGIRRNKRTKITTVDILFTALDLTHELAHLLDELDADRPTWHPKYAYCQRCFRDDKTYMAKGLCASCYHNRHDPNWKPPVGDQSWAMRYPCCVVCKKTDSPHAAHGRCRVCDNRWRRAGKPVSSGHGNPRSPLATP